MSLEQYQTLAKQEQLDIPNSIFSKLLQNLKIISSCLLFPWNHTNLENLLIKDDSTFINPLTKTYSSYINHEKYGDIFQLKIPHPLRTQLNNSAISKEIRIKLEKKIEETPILIFIHGLGGNFQQFDEIISNFNGITDILAIDLPGSGFSKFNNFEKFNLSLENYCNCIKEIIKINEFENRKLIFIGHSYGCQIILKLLINQILNVKGLIILTPPKISIKKTIKENFLIKFLNKFPIFFEIFRKFDRINNLNSKSMNRLFNNLNLINDFIKFKQFRFNLLTNSKNFLNQLQNWEPLTINELIKSSHIIKSNNGHILIIDGEKDLITQNGGESYFNLFGETISSYKKIKNLGHNLMLENCEKVNYEIDFFLQKIDSKLNKKYVDLLRSKLSEVEVL